MMIQMILKHQFIIHTTSMHCTIMVNDFFFKLAHAKQECMTWCNVTAIFITAVSI